MSGKTKLFNFRVSDIDLQRLTHIKVLRGDTESRSKILRKLIRKEFSRLARKRQW